MIFKKSVQNGSIYIQILRYFIGCIVSLVIILAAILYYIYDKSTLKTLNYFNAKILSQISYSSTYMDDFAQKYCKSLYSDNAVTAFLNSNEEDIFTISNAMDRIDVSVMPNFMIDSIYLYNDKLDIILSTKSRSFGSLADFYDRDAVELINSHYPLDKLLSPNPRSIVVPPNADVNSYIDPKTDVYTYIVTNSYKGEKSSGAIIVNIDTRWLTGVISTLEDKSSLTSGETFVIDKNGTVLNHSNNDMFMENITNRKYVQDILSSNKSSGIIIDTTHEGKSAVSYVSSTNLGWKFVNVTPYDIAFSGLSDIRVISLWACLAVLILGFSFVFYASKKIYSPISNLTHTVKKNLKLADSDVKKEKNEIHLLSNAFSNAATKISELETRERSNFYTLKNRFLCEILDETLKPDSADLSAKKSEYDIKLDFNSRILMFIFKIDNFEGFTQSHSPDDRLLYKFAIANIAGEITSELYQNEVVDNQPDSIIVLTNIPESETVELIHQNALSIISSTLENLKKYFSLSLSACIGGVANSYSHIPDIYRYTTSLSQYRLLLGHGCVVMPSVLENIDDAEFEFPAQKGKALIEAIKNGKIDDTKSAYLDIIKTVSRFSYDKLVISITNIAFLLYNNFTDMFASSCENSAVSFWDFQNKLNLLETLDEINYEFITMFERIIATSGKTEEHGYDGVVKTIITVIDESFFNKELCLKSIADSLMMSSIYLGKVFKDTTGKSVAEYITIRRMEQVKLLLETTSMPVSEIIESVGMEKTNYFYTTFKKHFGMSLSSYKAQLLKKRIEQADDDC